MPDQAVQMPSDVGLQEISLRPVQNIKGDAPQVLADESQGEPPTAREDLDEKLAAKPSSEQPLV